MLKEKQRAYFFSLRGVAVLTLLWGLANALVRLLAGTRLAMDDAKENIFTQSLEWGYLPDNPPLFEWTLNAVQWLTGPEIWSFFIVKYALLTGTALFTFLTARRLLHDEKWAAISALSLVTLYQIGWNYHQAFTHSCMVIFSVSVAVFAFVRLLQDRRTADYFLFGAAIGLGMMSKYNFAGVLAALLIPALSMKETRKVLLDWRSPAALSLGVLIVLPHLVWVMTNSWLFGSFVGGKLGWTEEASHLARAAEGLSKSLVAIISFYLPMILLALALYPAFRKRGLALPTDSDRMVLSLLGRSALASAGLILAGVVLFGVSGVTERYVIPFFLPSFFWLMARLKAASGEGLPRRWLAATGAMAAFILVMRAAIFLIAEPPLCDPCRRWVPFDGLTAAMNEKGVNTDGIFIAYDEDTAGNLRRAFPRAVVRSVNLMFYQPQKADTGKACYFVWSEDLTGQPLIPLFEKLADQPGRFDMQIDWIHPLKDEWLMTQWGVAPVASDSPDYKRWCTVDGFRIGRKRQ